MGDYLNDPSGKLNYLDMPCSQVVVNYPLIIGEPDSPDVSTFGGATRQIPGTHTAHQRSPAQMVCNLSDLDQQQGSCLNICISQRLRAAAGLPSKHVHQT